MKAAPGTASISALGPVRICQKSKAVAKMAKSVTGAHSAAARAPQRRAIATTAPIVPTKGSAAICTKVESGWR